MKTIIDNMFKLKNWAVLGATPTTSKFGYKIFKKLKSCHFNVIPVNPRYETVEDVPCIPNLKGAHSIEVVNVVVAPELALAALDDISEAGIEYVWFQPGAYNQAVLEKANKLGLKVVHGYCVLVELGDLPFCPL